MKASTKLFIIGSFAGLLSDCSKTEVVQPILIAQYPLTSNGRDLTGFNADMTLMNTTFQNGGIYSNGINTYDSIPVSIGAPVAFNPSASVIQSPPLRFFNFQSFSISLDFFVSINRTQPVWVIGTNCRWLGFYLNADSTIALFYNNNNFVSIEKTYSLNQWHEARISYDGTIVKVYFDDVLVGSRRFGKNGSQLGYTTCNTYDTQVGIVNYSDGSTFNGFVRNMIVHSPL